MSRKLISANETSIDKNLVEPCDSVISTIWARLLAFLCIVSGVLTITMSALYQRSIWFVLSGLFFLVVGALFLLKSKKYDGYSNSCVEPLLKLVEPSLQTKRSFEGLAVFGSISKADIGSLLKEKGAIPCYNSSFCHDFVIDTLSSNDDGFLYSHAVAFSTSRGNDSKETSEPTFRGPVIVVKMNRNLGSEVCLHTKNPSLLDLNEANQSNVGKKIETNSKEFDEHFEVFASDESQALGVLTPGAMRRLIDAKNKYGDFGMWWKGDHCVFAVNLGCKSSTSLKHLANLKDMKANIMLQDASELATMVYELKDSFQD